MTAEMRLLQLSDVEDSQSVVGVDGPLNEGLVSISNICKSLLDSQVDQTTDMCSNYKEIRGHIEHATQCLALSASVIEEKLRHLDACMERLIKEKENAEQRKKEKYMAKNRLNIEKSSAEESLKNSKAALEEAEKNLESETYALKVCQDRRSSGMGLRTAGAALIVIPIIGWIAGPIMICEGDRAVNEASKDIRDAEDELKKKESRLKVSSMRVSNYQSSISRIESETQEIDMMLNKIQREIEKMKQQLEVRVASQNMIRSAVNLLSVFSGRVSVLESQTQHFILQQPVMNVIEDVVSAAGNIADNQFLYSQGASVLMNTLRKNFGELKSDWLIEMLIQEHLVFGEIACSQH